MSAPAQPLPRDSRSVPTPFATTVPAPGGRASGARAPVRNEDLAAPARVIPRTRSERICRIANVAIAGTALVVLSPVLLAVAAAVKLTSPGPILYRQTRVGLDRRRRRHDVPAVYDRRVRDLGGSVFVIYKFRSMYIDAERGTGAVWATESDPRVTPIGRVLRKMRLDELPQLVNVIRGDMNIVGPRPERPSIVDRLRTDIVEYPLRQAARPGITGLAQVNRCYDACLDDVREKVRYDLEYIGRQGMAEDLRIMLRTVPVVLFRRGGW